VFWAFILLNILFGAFISATSAKTALLLPLFMVISAMYGATGGGNRNNVGRNMVLQNLLANNVSASAFITGSAANLLAAQLLEKAGAKVFYGDWLMALLPLCLLQCAIAYWSGTKLIFPISKEDATPKVQGGMQKLREELAKLGPISGAEIRAGVVFLAVLGLWSTDQLHGIRAEIVAVIGAIAVCMPSFSKLPRLGVMNWNNADIPWHMLMFSWGAYVLGGMVDKTNILGLTIRDLFATWGITIATPKVYVFVVMAVLFGFTTLISESKTARTIIMFPILIATAKEFNWDIIGFCLPMAFLINQVYVLYFNSKPANISYLTDHYSTGESFKFGMIQLVVLMPVLVLWTQYVMPLMGFNSRLW
jgi:sodium-dependent dicarboxylate transporter 2/3/5